MPGTINGIGTNYVGKSNVLVREAQCHSCTYYGALASYDTRLCFVVIFIPIIPLGKKRIIDECPSCRKHYVFDADKYVEVKRDAIIAVMQAYEQTPSIESGLEVHGTMLMYQQTADADAFREQFLQRFPNDSELLLALGGHLDSLYRFEESASLYDRAYQLNPESIDVRYRLARVRINHGQLDEARQLLNFLEAPGASKTYSLSLLETLAVNYQNAGRHIEAVELFNHLHKELPDVAKNYQFRKMVNKSETSLQMPVSVLPKQNEKWWSIFHPKSSRFSAGQRNAAYAMVATILALIVAASSNLYIRDHRKLHIVSGLTKPATIQIDGQSPQQVQSYASFPIAEGSHKIQVLSPIQKQYDIEIESSYFARFFRSPAWIVNIEGTAPLYEAQHFYAKNPTKPSTLTWHVGETFVALDNIDYIFTPIPKTIDVKDHETLRKTEVAVHTTVTPIQAASIINDDNALLSFLKAHLPANSEDPALSFAYLETIEKTGQNERAKKYFEAGLSRRPIEINWHRAYQTICEKLRQTDELEKTYAKFLTDDPQNGVLCYLCSRIEADSEKAKSLLDRAVAAAPESAWVQYAVGYDHRSKGKWAEALAAYEKAAKLGFDPAMIRGMKHLPSLVTGKSKSLIAEYRAIIEADKTDHLTMFLLCDAYVHTDQRAAAFQTLESWKTENPQLLAQPAMASAVTAYRCNLLYELGDFEVMLKEAKEQNDLLIAAYQNLYDLTTLHPERSEEKAQENKATYEGWGSLTRSISYKMAGNDEKAKEWLDEACAKLRKEGKREQKIAELLQADQAPEFATIEMMPLDEIHKLLTLCALAKKFPDQHDQYAGLAAKLNVSLAPPYHLILKVFPKAISAVK